jgi:CubicO group peptidase (beta-lactamase class C family)
LVSAYRPADHGLELYDSPSNSAWGRPPAFPDAAAGLVSTVDDFFAFSRFMLERGTASGRRLLSEAAVTAMTTNRLTAEQRSGGAPILGADRGWALGMSVVVKKGAEGLPAGAYGWNGGLGTSWAADPQSGRTALLLTNTLFTSPVTPAVHQEFWRSLW